MNCLEFQTQLESAILERTTPAPELIEHACTCSVQDCRDLWSDYLLLEAQLPQWLEGECADSPLDPWSVVQAAAEPSLPERHVCPPARPETRQSMRRWLAVAVAGVAVVGVIAALNTSPDRRPLVQSPEVRLQPESALAEPRDTVASPVDSVEDSQQALTEISHTYVGWIHGSAHQISETVGFVLSTPPSMDPLPVLPWYETLQEQFRPIEESFQRTMDGVLQEVSGDSQHAS